MTASPVDQHHTVDAATLAADLRARVDGEIRFDEGTLATYATDASNYRQVPVGVVVPRTVESAVEAVAVCREHGAPVLSRGGGTSVAGQCTNTAVVIDWSKYCTRILDIDADHRRALVESGTVLDDLQDALAPYGLIYGPSPATHASATLGGMIGNNSCGATAMMAGKVADNIEALEVLTYDGERMWVGPTSDEEYAEIVAAGGRRAEIYRRLRALRDEHMAQVRTSYPDIPRRVSGYNLDALLPEGGFDLARALVGTEGTCVTVLRAQLRLVPKPAHTGLVVLGYPDITRGADAVPAIAAHHPIALEGIDANLVSYQQLQNLNPAGRALLPPGGGWLLVRFGGNTPEEVAERARALIAELDAGPESPAAAFLDDPGSHAAVWAVRESALGATAHVPGLPNQWEGWEDTAVRPDQLGDYLRELYVLLSEYGYDSTALYGHLGHGCIHARIPFDLRSEQGIAAMREFVERGAELVVRYGGSLSGEHGDGQSRAELYPVMFGEDIVRAFGEFKAAWDPVNRMNPGKVVDPYPLDENLRLGADFVPWEPETFFRFSREQGSFSQATLRCAGVGKCRNHGGSVMCPSYQAVGEEQHSTRGRARLLFEMLQGDVITDGWRSEAVHDALDLCLSCKGCKSDCPVSVDMATYKAEFLAHHYAGRLRPASHYSMGWLPLWARLAALAPSVVNTLTQLRGPSRLLKAAGGIAQQRPIPAFAERRFSDWYRKRGPRGSGERGDVVLWPDTFTDNLHPAVGRAAVEVLEDAGFRVRLPRGAACCGLTWVSTGQLRTARRVQRHTLNMFADAIDAGTPIVALEPSCAAVFRDEAAELAGSDEDARRMHRLGEQVVTLAELLSQHAPQWRPPHLERGAVVQAHCHQHAIMGFDADLALMRSAGLRPQRIGPGCCGLAGNFGFEAEHYDVSRAVGEQSTLPAVREADPDALVIADGFSCRTQIDQGGTGRQALHLVEVLAAGIRGELADGTAAIPTGARPSASPAGVRWLAGAGFAAGLAAAGVLVWRRRSR